MQTIQRDVFLKKLESVSVGIANKELLENSACFLFNAGRISTFNDAILASIPTELKIKGTIPAEELLKLFRKIKDKEVKIGREENKIIVKGKLFKTEFNMEEETSYEILNEIEIPKKFKKLPKNFIKLVRLACMTAGSSLSEALLMNIHIYKDVIESCDNDRITFCNLGKNLGMDVLIPAKNITEIIKQDITGIAHSNGWLHFKGKDDVLLSSRLVEEKYINLKQYIPTGKGEKITFPEQVKGMLDRADIFSKEETTSEKMIRVDLTSKRVILTSQNASGKHTERKKLKYSGPDITFEINPDFFRDVLSLSHTISIIDNTLMFKDDQSTHLIKLEG